eukprot:m.151971 g.151971  ORF g.151971 m.151971 type:complete len:390 (+) comp11701_c0_seq6:922-2091(+)
MLQQRSSRTQTGLLSTCRLMLTRLPTTSSNGPSRTTTVPIPLSTPCLPFLRTRLKSNRVAVPLRPSTNSICGSTRSSTHQRSNTSACPIPLTSLSASTHKVSFDIAAGVTANAPPCTVPLRTVVNACGIAPASLAEPLSFDVHSAGRVGTDVVNGTDMQVTDFKLMTYQNRVLDEQMARKLHMPLDYRYLKPKVEKRSISLTNGSTTVTTLQNFGPDDLCSHMWVVLRGSTLTGLNRESFLDYATNIWLEDENGQNVTSGIQWKGTDLVNIQTPRNFYNDFQANHKIYLVFCPSSDPVADYHKGSMNGAQPLGRNWKLNITSNATATVNAEVRAYCYKHVRVEGEATTSVRAKTNHLLHTQTHPKDTHTLCCCTRSCWLLYHPMKLVEV